MSGVANWSFSAVVVANGTGTLNVGTVPANEIWEIVNVNISVDSDTPVQRCALIDYDGTTYYAFATTYYKTTWSVLIENYAIKEGHTFYIYVYNLDSANSHTFRGYVNWVTTQLQ